MTVSLLQLTRGKFYLGLMIAAGLCLALAPFLVWLQYDLLLSQGAVQSQVFIFVTGFGSIFPSSEVAGVSFSFPMLQNWWYGTLALAVGALTLALAFIVVRRPELGGLAGFIMSFINMPPSLFFMGRTLELNNIANQFVQALQGAGYTLVAGSSGYALGFIIDVLATFLLPISSILILSNAAKLRMARRREEDRRAKEAEESAKRFSQ